VAQVGVPQFDSFSRQKSQWARSSSSAHPLGPCPVDRATLLLRELARRVRANKSLIKQRYHVAKVAFPDDADLARSLGVHRSAVVRWKRGEAPAPQNWEQLIGLDAVVSLLEGFLELASIPKWLRGLNAHLGERRPIDVIRQGRLSEVVRAIEAERAGAFA